VHSRGYIIIRCGTTAQRVNAVNIDVCKRRRHLTTIKYVSFHEKIVKIGPVDSEIIGLQEDRNIIAVCFSYRLPCLSAMHTGHFTRQLRGLSLSRANPQSSLVNDYSKPIPEWHSRDIYPHSRGMHGIPAILSFDNPGICVGPRLTVS